MIIGSLRGLGPYYKVLGSIGLEVHRRTAKSGLGSDTVRLATDLAQSSSRLACPMSSRCFT